MEQFKVLLCTIAAHVILLSRLCVLLIDRGNWILKMIVADDVTTPMFPLFIVMYPTLCLFSVVDTAIVLSMITNIEIQVIILQYIKHINICITYLLFLHAFSIAIFHLHRYLHSILRYILYTQLYSRRIHDASFYCSFLIHGCLSPVPGAYCY